MSTPRFFIVTGTLTRPGRPSASGFFDNAKGVSGATKGFALAPTDPVIPCPRKGLGMAPKESPAETDGLGGRVKASQHTKDRRKCAPIALDLSAEISVKEMLIEFNATNAPHLKKQEQATIGKSDILKLNWVINAQFQLLYTIRWLQGRDVS